MKKFKSVFVELKEMEGLRKKIGELLSDKRNVALGSDRTFLQEIRDTPRTEAFMHGRCSIQARDFINDLFATHKRWEKERQAKQAAIEILGEKK